MTRTKQTAYADSSSRLVGMATARFEDPEQFEDIKDIGESEWPDLDNPPQAAEKGETSKPTANQHTNTASR